MKLEKIWQQYKNAIKAFLYCRVSNEADRADLLQNILIKIFNNLHTLHAESNIKSWIFTITNRTIIDYYRKNDKAMSSLPIEGIVTVERDNNITMELAKCISPFVNYLSESSKELIIAIDLDSHPQKDYAKKQDVNYSTLKSRVQKARNELKSLFEQCCQFSFDQQGNVIDFSPKSDTCKKC